MKRKPVNKAKRLVSQPRFASRRQKSRKDYRRKPKHAQAFTALLFVILAGVAYMAGARTQGATPSNPVFMLTPDGQIHSIFELAGQEHRASARIAPICSAWTRMHRSPSRT